MRWFIYCTIAILSFLLGNCSGYDAGVENGQRIERLGYGEYESELKFFEGELGEREEVDL